MNNFVSIEISKGLSTIIDEEDQSKVSRWKWKVLKNHAKDRYKANFYVARNVYYFDKFLNKKIYKTILLHRYLIDAPDGLLVDHINGNTLDNRKSNLRLCHNSQNHANRQSNSDKKNTPGFKRVSYRKEGNWEAFASQIRFNSTTIDLGCYEIKEEAAFAYDIAAKLLFKEFACLNFQNKVPINMIKQMEIVEKISKKLKEKGFI